MVMTLTSRSDIGCRVTSKHQHHNLGSSLLAHVLVMEVFVTWRAQR